VAGNDEVLFTHFDYQSESDSWLEPGLPSEFARSLYDLSGGSLRTAGGNIVDSATHRIVGRISIQSGASLSVGTDGTILLNNVTTKSRLREVMGTDAIPRAIVSGDLSVFGAAFPADINRTITLAPRGQVIYVDSSRLPGKSAYSRVNMAVYGDMGAPSSNSLGTLATADQLLIRGVAGWMSRNAPAAIDRLKLQGVQLPDGTTSTNGSDIIRAIAANISVTPVVTYVIQEGE
jgi:hypothetical protein